MFFKRKLSKSADENRSQSQDYELRARHDMLKFFIRLVMSQAGMYLGADDVSGYEYSNH